MTIQLWSRSGSPSLNLVPSVPTPAPLTWPKAVAERIRVLVADQHPLVRIGLRTVLSTQPDMRMVGEAKDGLEVQELWEDCRPDVLVLALNIPAPEPTELIASLHHKHPYVKIIVLTALGDCHYEEMSNLINLGVTGWLLKEEDPDILVRAIRAAASGVGWFDGRVVEALVKQQGHHQASLLPSNLTRREWEVLEHLSRGRNNKRIALALGITERTVRFHLGHIYDKLNVTTRGEAIAWTHRQGLRTE